MNALCVSNWIVHGFYAHCNEAASVEWISFVLHQRKGKVGLNLQLFFFVTIYACYD